MSKRNSNGPWIIVLLVILLVALHQDVWFWESKTVLFGFLPITLFWHACISIGATLTWALATRIAWPRELDENEQVASNQGGE